MFVAVVVMLPMVLDGCILIVAVLGFLFLLVGVLRDQGVAAMIPCLDDLMLVSIDTKY